MEIKVGDKMPSGTYAHPAGRQRCTCVAPDSVTEHLTAEDGPGENAQWATFCQRCRTVKKVGRM